MRLAIMLLQSVLVSLAILSVNVAHAERYSVSLTRKDSNLYKVDGKDVYVITRYCYVYAYAEDAILSDDEVVFIDDADKCDVKMVLAKAAGATTPKHELASPTDAGPTGAALGTEQERRCLQLEPSGSTIQPESLRDSRRDGRYCLLIARDALQSASVGRQR